MKKPSEYSSAELLELESNLPNADRAELEVFAKLGVIAQQWMNRKANAEDRGIPSGKSANTGEAAEWAEIDKLRAQMEEVV